ncbi:MAG TPA: DMT family transporter [Terriglobales bacterium]|nr:DMT family transporter [Terriglobales bacterium]
MAVPEPFAVPLTDLDIDADLGLAPPSLDLRPRAVSEPSALPLPGLDRHADLGLQPPSPAQRQTPTLAVAVGHTLRTKWFWYAMASSLCWTGWAFTAKLGSKEIPPAAMEFVSAFGFLLVSLGVVRAKTPQASDSRRGQGYALVSGILLALGGICLYGAYRTGYNASMITAVTSLYPMVTVLCAVGFLRERLNRMQVLGLLFAIAAMSILSL